MKKSALWLIILLALSACEEVVNVELQPETPLLVVEARIFNLPSKSYVKLTKTQTYNDQNPPQGISGATIYILENNTPFPFVEKTQGIYQNLSFVGVPARSYALSLVIDDDSITSRTSMPSLIKIDSLAYFYRKASPAFKEGYYVRIFSKDRLNTRNFYRYEILVNGIRLENRINLLDDKDLDGNDFVYEYPTPFALKLNDTLTVQLHNLTESGYRYYKGLQSLIEVASSPSQAAPENPIGNLTSRAKRSLLGCFVVSSIDEKQFVFTKK